MEYNKRISSEKLTELQNMTLDDKIKLSLDIIKDFGENYAFFDTKNEIKTHISSSFGKDSLVTTHLVRQLYPNIPIAFFDSGVEQPSTVAMSKNFENVIAIKPKKKMEDVIQEHGYMIPIGKERADAIESTRRNLYEGKFNTSRVKKMRGDYGEKSFFNFSNYQHVLLAPFKISAKCDHYLKIEPANRLKKQGYKYTFTGTTAEESRMRRNSFIKLGFITKDQCRPIGHWTEQDVLEYVLRENIKLPECYGDIVRDEKTGKLSTSKFTRTGCICCPVGAQYNKPNDFQRLYMYDRDSWDYVINELGFGQVLDFFEIPYHEYDEDND